MSDQVKLGRLLVDKGLLTPERLDAALAEQQHTGAPLGRVLVESGVVTEAQLVATLAGQLGLEFVDLDEVTVDPAAVAVLPDHLARRYCAVPVAWAGDRLVVAMADPSNVVAIDDIRQVAGVDVRTVVATRAAIGAAIDRTNRLGGEVEDVTAEVAAAAHPDDDLEQVREATEDAPVVKLANLLITQAVQDRASDIHIEPTERDVRIRFRVDGVLHEIMRSPRQVQAGLTSRLKIMAEIDITEKRVPQDGRISVRVAGTTIDLRVATLPTVYGEKIVMRILDNSTALLRLEDLGFLPHNMDRYRQAYTRPYGTILVTGPTGSGKSTTLYSTLNQVSDPTRNIITVEDPVEYRLAGINQVQVNKKAGLTFAAALRSILRSDPDVVLVGEIRDHETASMAMEAALTGHLVLSTLHTNDSTQTPTRLIEMGLEPFLVSSALDCVVAQRLARRLCERCKVAYTPAPAELTHAGWDHERLGSTPTLYRPEGCSLCARTGYRGRTAVHEVLLLTETLRSMVAARAHSDDLRKEAVSLGMLTLRDAGLMQVADGRTSLEEIFRVVA